MVALVVIGGIVLAALVIWWSVNWVLGPLDRAAKDRKYPLQFSLADFLCLFVLVDLPMGGIHCCVPKEQGVTGGVIAADVLVALLAVLVWWTGVRTLSRAGIHGTWRRSFILVVALPASYVGSIAIVGLPLFVIGPGLESGKSRLAVTLTVAEIATCGALYGLGRFTRAVVASASPLVDEPGSTDNSPDASDRLQG